MFARILLLFLAVSLFAACDEEPSTTNSATLLIGANDSANIPKPEARMPDSATMAWEGFAEIYEYGDEHEQQRLGITRLNRSTIAFQLHTENDLCTTTIGDTAKLMNEGQPQIDKDEKSTGYAAEDYLMQTPEFTLSIRPAVEKNKARFVYSPKVIALETNCFPYDGYLLKRKK